MGKKERKSITKKERFEVFKRDGFRCAYCGKCPPEVILEIDHIDPKSKGGKDHINNYITACFDCNRGKKDIPLDKIPPRLSMNLEVLKEQENQITEYRKFIKKIDRRLSKDIDDIEDVFSKTYIDKRFTSKFRIGTVKNLLKFLPKSEIIDSMYIALNKIPDDQERTIKYFCGICWNKIRGTKLEQNKEAI